VDPVTHMLTGACISRAGFNRTTAYATATWVLASEFPDIDVAYYLRGSVEAFAHHRGWTHTFMAAPLNAAVVVGGLYLFWKWRRSRNPEMRPATSVSRDSGYPDGSADQATASANSASPFRPLQLKALNRREREDAAEDAEKSAQQLLPKWGLLLLYGVLASFGHILLDYVTAYGVRPFEPFSFQWYSYDIVSIIEPLWLGVMALALAAPFFFGLVSEEVGEHKRRFKGRGWAIAALLFMLALWGYRDLQHRSALAALNSVLYRGSAANRVSAYPYAVNPYQWHGVVDTRDFYQTVEVNSRTGDMDDSDNGHTYYKPEETPITLAAKKTRLGRVYLDWATYPMIETLPEADGGWEVRFYDLRYVYPGRSSTVLGGYVLLDKDLHVIEESMGRRVGGRQSAAGR
jgi:inner membrane protein